LPFEALTPKPHFSGADLNSVLSSLNLWATHELQIDNTRHDTVFNSGAAQYAQFCVRAWRRTSVPTDLSPAPGFKLSPA
jgi:hypothetical protein